MKLADRYSVEGTDPPFQIGHKVKRDRHGTLRIGRMWTAQYCLGGRHRYVSLRTPNKAAAIRQVHEIALGLSRGEERVVAKRIALSQLVKQYLATQTDRGRASTTLVKYTQVLEELVEWHDERGSGQATSFTELDFWAFRGWMAEKRKKKLSPKTIEDRLTIVKQLFKFGAKNKLVPTNPVADASVPEAPSTPQPCFTAEQVAALIDIAGTTLDAAIYAVMAYTGMRFGEVRDLCWTDVRFNQGTHGFVVIQRGGSGMSTKNKKVRRIPIHPQLGTKLLALPRIFERIFPAPPSNRYPEGGAPLNERTVLKGLKELCARCKFTNPFQFKLHTFRHAFASMCARNNISYKYALTWMGHSSSEILDMYYTMFDATAEAAIDTITYPTKQPTIEEAEKRAS